MRGQRVILHSSDTVVSSSCFEKGIYIYSDQKIKVSSVLNLSGNLKTCSYDLLTIAGKHGKPVFVHGQNSDFAFVRWFYICIDEVPEELPVSRCISNT